MLSVDLPAGGLRPDPPRRQLVEHFAVHAALAIEHARVHTRIADSEQLFRAMFDRSPIAIALLTQDRCITMVNTALAARAMRIVRQPYKLGGEPVFPSISIGVALSGVGDSADSVLAHADRALYMAKAAGRSRWQLAASG